MLQTAVEVTFKSEDWSACLPELERIFPIHWKELACFQNQIQLNCDKERYASFEKAGILVLVTARAEGKLIGYFVGFTMPHPHYKGSGTWGMTDMYFILPEYRNGIGLKLFIAFEKTLKSRGCTHAVTSCKVHEDHTEFLEKLGWQWTDKTFQKHF